MGGRSDFRPFFSRVILSFNLRLSMFHLVECRNLSARRRLRDGRQCVLCNAA